MEKVSKYAVFEFSKSDSDFIDDLSDYLDNNIDTTLNVVNIRGLNYLNVHGDYDNFTSCQKVIEMLDIPIYCVHMGHLHHNKTDWMQKYKLIMSGSIQGMDDFCIQKRIFGKACHGPCRAGIRKGD